MTTPALEPQAELDQMRAERAAMQIQMARWEVYAKHPHLQAMGLLENFQGGPDQIKAFGDQLAERIPPPAPTPAPLTAAPAPQPAPLAQPVPAPPQAAQPPPAPPAAPAAPENSAVPTPSPQDILTQQTADVARADDIRERMKQGLATRQEVLWLSQWGPRREEDLGNGLRGMTGGFVAAVKEFGTNRNARLGV